MPIPKKLESKYATIIAAQTARLEKSGMSKAQAKKKGKAIAEKYVAHRKNGGKKAKK